MPTSRAGRCSRIRFFSCSSPTPRNNLDLQTAIFRVEQSRQLIGVKRADLPPQIDYRGAASRQKAFRITGLYIMDAPPDSLPLGQRQRLQREMHREQLRDKARELDVTTPADTFQIELRDRYHPDVKSIVAMVPATISLRLVFIPAMLSALSVVREKEMAPSSTSTWRRRRGSSFRSRRISAARHPLSRRRARRRPEALRDPVRDRRGAVRLVRFSAMIGTMV